MLAEFAEALQRLPIATVLRTDPMLYPIVNGLHIVALALLFGAIAVVDVKLIRDGLVNEQTLKPAFHLAMLGLLGALVTGVLIFSVRAVEYISNPIFLLKLALIATGIANALFLHAVRRFQIGHPPYVRLAGFMSLALWASTIFAGRMLGFW